jgi:hypothetical protein
VEILPSHPVVLCCCLAPSKQDGTASLTPRAFFFPIPLSINGQPRYSRRNVPATSPPAIPDYQRRLSTVEKPQQTFSNSTRLPVFVVGILSCTFSCTCVLRIVRSSLRCTPYCLTRTQPQPCQQLFRIPDTDPNQGPLTDFTTAHGVPDAFLDRPGDI